MRKRFVIKRRYNEMVRQSQQNVAVSDLSRREWPRQG
jgi:hypothetical protein